MSEPANVIETARDISSASTVHGPTANVQTGYVVVPEGYRVHDLESLGFYPRRIREKVSLNTPASFQSYVKRFADKGAMIMADLDNNRFVAHLDYHADTESPSWSDHKATYACPMSREWLAWKGVDGKWLDQEAFATFLEDRCHDVTQPNGTELLQIALEFKLIKKAEFGSAKNLHTGEFSFGYSEENEKGTIEVPSELTITIPVYHGDAAYNIRVRLRYRLSSGVLAFRFDLVEPEVVGEDAFRTVMEGFIKELPDVLVLEGKA